MLLCSYSKINVDYTIADFHEMEVLTRLKTVYIYQNAYKNYL